MGRSWLWGVQRAPHVTVLMIVLVACTSRRLAALMVTAPDWHLEGKSEATRLKFLSTAGAWADDEDMVAGPAPCLL